MIAAFNHALTALVGLLLHPLRAASPWLAMLAIAAAAALLVLAIFRLCTRPARIRRRKNRVLARIMEMRVYQDDPVITLTAFGRALSANALYLACLLPAVAASLIPLALLLIQVHAWLGLRPLAAGEACLVTAWLAPGHSVVTTPVELRTSAGLALDSPGVRQPGEQAITWRIRADTPNRDAWAEVVLGDQVWRTPVAAGPHLQAKAPLRSTAGILDQMANPAAPPLPPDGAIRAIAIAYPAYTYRVFGHPWHWLAVFLSLSLLIAYPLQRPFGVVV